MTNDGSSAHYELTLLQERSAGTFARVYLAEARSAGGIDRIVAVKVLKDQWSEHDEMLIRTHDEARLLARLHHKNILGVEAMTTIQGQPAIVMEFVDGIDLAQLIEQLRARGRSLPPRTIYRIGADAASALHAAYFRVPYGRTAPLCVVHRDLKPSNIMVSIEGEVKVLDFGTARFNSEARVAQTGVLRFGSMKYMSPERRLGDRGDHASDVYALGLVILELLVGEEIPLLSMAGQDHQAELDRVIARLPDHGLPNAEWAESLRQTLHCMCAPDPDQRLDAGQALELLRAFADQAAGDSLESFAMHSIAPITRELYGDGVDGDLTGSRIFVGLGAGAPLQLARSAEAPSASPTDTATLTTTSSPTSPSLDGPTRFERLGPSGPGAGPTPASGPSTVPPAAEGPAHTRPMVAAGPSPSPTVASAPTASPPPDHRRALIIGALVGFLGVSFVGLLGVAGLALWLWRDAGVQAGPGPAGALETAEAAPEADDAPAPGDASILVRATDDTIRWLKLNDPSGAAVLRGRPDIDGSAPPGAYRLEAKVAGRSTAGANIEVVGDIELVCTPAKAEVVRCQTDSGTVLELRP